MSYVTNINEVKKNDIYVMINNDYGNIEKLLKKGVSKIICDKKYKDKRIKNVKNVKKYLEKVIQKENKILNKYTNIILIMGYKYKYDVAFNTYKYFVNQKESVILLKNNGYYINKKYHKINSSISKLTINKLLNIAKEKNIKQFIIAINNVSLKSDILKSLEIRNTTVTSFIGNDHKYLRRILNKTNDSIIINNDESFSKIIRKKYKNVITVGKKGNYKIDFFYKQFEYEYNLYNMTVNDTNGIYSLILTYATLSSLGYNLNNIKKVLTIC